MTNRVVCNLQAHNNFIEKKEAHAVVYTLSI